MPRKTDADAAVVRVLRLPKNPARSTADEARLARQLTADIRRMPPGTMPPLPPMPPPPPPLPPWEGPLPADADERVRAALLSTQQRDKPK
jgi:hypothetical protein